MKKYTFEITIYYFFGQTERLQKKVYEKSKESAYENINMQIHWLYDERVKSIKCKLIE